MYNSPQANTGGVMTDVARITLENIIRRAIGSIEDAVSLKSDVENLSLDFELAIETSLFALKQTLIELQKCSKEAQP